MGKGRFDLDALVERLLEEAPPPRGTDAPQGAGGNALQDTPPGTAGDATRDGGADVTRPGTSSAMSPGSSPGVPRRAVPKVTVSPEMKEAAQQAAMADDPRVAAGVHKHPLAAARAALGLSAPQYLKQINRIYQQLGFGAMACRPEKVSRWEAGVWSPERPAQVAMATLHNIPYELLDEAPWPQWLLYAFPDDGNVLSTPWTPRGTVTAMTSCVRGGAVDRRGFLIATGTTLGALAADWSGALSGIAEAAAVDGEAAEALTAVAQGRARRLTMSMVAGLEQRLESLRRLEDIMGGDQLCKAARAEFELLDHLANKASYDEATGRRLFSTVAEAARITGWVHYDHGLHAAAQKYFITGLRASATAGDPVGGAYILTFMASQTYNVGNPQDAVGLLQTAQERAGSRATAAVRAYMHATAARAHAKTPYGRYACVRELEKARTAVAAGSHDDDPPWIYWITRPEIEMMAASAALDLGDPRRALDFFRGARTADYADAYAKNDAIHLVWTADAYLALGEIDAACETALEAYLKGKEIDSARQSGALTDFRTRLKAKHRGSRTAKDFLDLTAA